MFQAVRQWVGDGDWRRLGRLFAFEFLVVVAGVLAAQGLQSWVAERSARDSGRAQLAGARFNVASLGRAISFWADYGPCLRNHVERVATVAASGGDLTQQQIGRPALPTLPMTSWTEEGRQRALLVVDERQLAGLVLLNAIAQNVNDAEQEIGREWASLRLIDAAMGKPLAQDRSRVRQAAAAIDNRIGYLLYTRNQVRTLASQLAIPLPTTASPTVQSLIDRCGLLKDWR